MNFKTMNLKSWKLKLKNDLLYLFSLMYSIRFIIISRNVGFWIFIFWWIRENVYWWWHFNFILNESVTHCDVQIATTLTILLLVLNIANVLWFCGFKICYVVSQSWIALHLCAPFHKKTFCCSCLKPPRLGKTHLTSCVWHLCSWMPMVLSICLQMLLVLL